MIYPFIFCILRGFVWEQNFNISDVAILVKETVNFCNIIPKMNINLDINDILTFSVLDTAFSNRWKKRNDLYLC